MKNELERERLLYNINRFDHYFESVNNKASVYLAMTTFLLSGIFAGYFSVSEYILEYRLAFNTLLVTEALVGIVAIIIIAVASIPYFSKDSDSLYYFGGIGSMPKESFCEYSQKLSFDLELKDLRNQVHTLSVGLSTKFSRLKISGYLLVLQFVFLIPMILILMLNLF